MKRTLLSIFMMFSLLLSTCLMSQPMYVRAEESPVHEEADSADKISEEEAEPIPENEKEVAAVRDQAENELKPNYEWYTANPDATEYSISSVEDLMGLADITRNRAEGIGQDNFAGKTVKLANDLDLSSMSWYSTDDAGTVVTDYRIEAFVGTFDGQNHTISNLSFKNNGEGVRLGMFTSILEGGKVQNLKLDKVSAELSDGDELGVLARGFQGSAKNCHVSNVTVVGNNPNKEIKIAGMFWFVRDKTEESDVHITDCTVSNIQVNAEGKLRTSGGLVGYANGGTLITDSHVSDVAFSASKFSAVGGLSGNTQGTTKEKPVVIKNSTVENISFKANDIQEDSLQNVGGFRGNSIKGWTYYEGCAVSGVEIKSMGRVYGAGGFSGANYHGDEYINCKVENAKITSDDLIEVSGGFIGVNYTGKTVESKFIGCDVDGVEIVSKGNMADVGGFTTYGNIGDIFQECSVNDVKITSDGNMKNMGGFLAFNCNKEGAVTYEACNVNDVKITSNGNMEYVGGFSGINNKGVTYEACNVNKANITCTNPDGKIMQIGGFTGNTQNGTTTLNKFTNCSVAGLEMKLTGVTADADNSVGGFVANLANDTQVIDCSVQEGSIDTTELKNAETGGFLGNLGWNKMSIELQNCKADVDIKAKGSAGGFVGSSSMEAYADSRDVVAQFTNCKATGNIVSMEGAAGGFVGDGNRGIYTGCEATGNVTGVVTGGFWGEVTPNPNPNVTDEIIISDCAANGQVEGSKFAGGFVGNAQTQGEGNKNTSLKVENSTAALVVLGNSKDAVVGDFVNAEANDPNISLNENTDALIVIGGNEVTLYREDEKLESVLEKEVEYIGEGTAPVLDLIGLKADGVNRFTVQFITEDLAQYGVLENKTADELTKEAVREVAPTKLGTYTMIISGENDESGNCGLVMADFEIVKGTPVGTPTFDKVESAVSLSEVALTGTMKNKAGLEVAGTFAWTDENAVVEVDKEYTWTFVPAEADNYKEVSGKAIVWEKESEDPNTEKPDTDKPDQEKPDTEKPGIDKPGIDNPDIDRPNSDKPNVDQPTDSQMHSGTEKTDNEVKPVETGDKTNIILYAGETVLSVLVILAVVIAKMKQRKKIR